MNTLKDIRDIYKITNIRLAEILHVNKSTINTLLDRELNVFSLKQLIALHEEIKAPYNVLLNEALFNCDNINDTTENTKTLSVTTLLDTIASQQRTIEELSKQLAQKQ